MASENATRNSGITFDDWKALADDCHPTRCTFLYKLLLRVSLWILAVTIFIEHVVTTVQGYMRFGRKRSLDAQFRNTFSKLPQHLALSLTSYPQDGNSLSKATSCLARLVAWCAIVGIPYVTMYDHEGMLKSCANELRQLVDDHLSAIAGTNRPRSKCIIRMSDDDSTQNNNMQLETERKDIVQVQLLSHLDGRQDLVAACRRLAVRCKNKPSTELVATDFIEQMQSNRGFPYPDVLVCWGELFSPIGFLPWHTNLTEIIHLPSRTQLTFDTFHRILSRFDKCEKRFGK